MVSRHVPVFIQPDSEQPCLLGMNAAPSLGLSFCRANGEPITCKANPTQSVSASVCLIQTTQVPGCTGVIPFQFNHTLQVTSSEFLQTWHICSI